MAQSGSPIRWRHRSLFVHRPALGRRPGQSRRSRAAADRASVLRACPWPSRMPARAWSSSTASPSFERPDSLRLRRPVLVRAPRRTAAASARRLGAIGEGQPDRRCQRRERHPFGQRRFGAPALGDVAQVAGEHRRSVGGDWRDGDLHRKLLAVPCGSADQLETPVQARRLAGSRDNWRQRRAVGVALVGGNDQLGQLDADGLAPRCSRRSSRPPD